MPPTRADWDGSRFGLGDKSKVEDRVPIERTTETKSSAFRPYAGESDDWTSAVISARDPTCRTQRDGRDGAIGPTEKFTVA